MLEIMASLWRIFEARNTYALSKFHREHMHPGIDNASFGSGGLVRKYRHSTTSPLKNQILKLAGGKSRSSALEHSLSFHFFFFYILFHPSPANTVPLSRIQIAFDAHFKPRSSRKRMTPQHRKGELFLLGLSAS